MQPWNVNREIQPWNMNCELQPVGYNRERWTVSSIQWDSTVKGEPWNEERYEGKGSEWPEVKNNFAKWDLRDDY